MFALRDSKRYTWVLNKKFFWFLSDSFYIQIFPERQMLYDFNEVKNQVGNVYLDLREINQCTCH